MVVVVLFPAIHPSNKTRWDTLKPVASDEHTW
jgi:hypothetical protein